MRFVQGAFSSNYGQALIGDLTSGNVTVSLETVPGAASYQAYLIGIPFNSNIAAPLPTPQNRFPLVAGQSTIFSPDVSGCYRVQFEARDQDNLVIFSDTRQFAIAGPLGVIPITTTLDQELNFENAQTSRLELIIEALTSAGTAVTTNAAVIFDPVGATPTDNKNIRANRSPNDPATVWQAGINDAKVGQTCLSSTTVGDLEFGVNSNYGTIGGGLQNRCETLDDIILGGATIAGGIGNVCNADRGFIGGGSSNRIGESGGGANSPTVTGSVIAGGTDNVIEGVDPSTLNAAILGGENNLIRQGSNHATIGGGRNNLIGPNGDQTCSWIAGGEENIVSDVTGAGAVGAGIIGSFCTVSGRRAVARGFRATAVNHYQAAFAMGQSTDGRGEQQTSEYVFWAEGNTPQLMRTGPFDDPQPLTLEESKAYRMTVDAIAYAPTGPYAKSWSRTGIVARETGGGASIMVAFADATGVSPLETGVTGAWDLTFAAAGNTIEITITTDFPARTTAHVKLVEVYREGTPP